MLRKSMLLPLLSLLAAGAAAAQQPATAQQPAARQPTAAQQVAPRPLEEPPRQLDQIEKEEERPLIPPKGPTTRIVEKKVGNTVTEATVTAAGSTYTLRPNKPVGTAEVGEVSAGPSRAPLWSVMQFGVKKPKDAEATAEGEQATTTTAAGQRATVPPPPRPDAAPVK
ncbi:MAG TPA: hypothetical protein VFT37_12390 [Telluria sp.]|nr:hypothetical protein [Telluria sp.]